MFTKGQLIFAIFFIVAFIGLMIFSYRKDAKRHKMFYDKTPKKVGFWIFVVFAAFLLLRFHGAVRTFFFGS